jgi:hypothetical protein
MCGNTSEASFSSVWGTGAQFYAAGNAGAVCYTSGNGSWAGQASGTSATTVYGVGGTSATDLHLVGVSGTTSLTYYLSHSNGGGTWVPDNLPAATPGRVGTNPFWGLDATAVYLAGRTGQLFLSTGNGNWTASQIVLENGDPVTADLYSIWGSGPRNIYVVGAGGLILHSR